MRRLRILVFGAGVVGQVYGGRLCAAGHDVALLARGAEAERLAAEGVTLASDAHACHVRPAVVAHPDEREPYDLALVTVRRDQLDAALPALAALPARQVALLLNLPADHERVRERIGAERTLLAFPGVGGERAASGAIRYLEVPQQKTTVERRDGAEQLVAELLRSAHLPVEVEPAMADWLATHAVFMTAMSAAILGCGGDATALAADRRGVRELVAAVGEGFRALAASGRTVTPAPLRTIFTRAPRPIAVRYWRGQLRGPVGTLAIAPHARASRDTELPLLCDDVRRLLRASGRPAPRLERLLATVAPAAPPRAEEAA